MDRIAELHRQLIDERDDALRATMHVELGEMALRDGRLDAAERHFREATLFDGSLERARTGLIAAGGPTAAPAPRGFFSAMIERIRAR